MRSSSRCSRRTVFGNPRQRRGTQGHEVIIGPAGGDVYPGSAFPAESTQFAATPQMMPATVLARAVTIASSFPARRDDVLRTMRYQRPFQLLYVLFVAASLTSLGCCATGSCRGSVCCPGDNAQPDDLYGEGHCNPRLGGRCRGVKEKSDRPLARFAANLKSANQEPINQPLQPPPPPTQAKFHPVPTRPVFQP